MFYFIYNKIFVRYFKWEGVEVIFFWGRVRVVSREDKGLVIRLGKSGSRVGFRRGFYFFSLVLFR